MTKCSSAVACLAAVLSWCAMSSGAHAFGGLWSAPDARVEQAGAQIILVDHPGPTVTAIVQIQYAGAGEDFAWVIPVTGTPTVAMSSNAVFERLDAATAPEYWLEVATDGMCMAQELSDAGLGEGTDVDGTPSLPGTAQDSIIVLHATSVGSYNYSHIAIAPAADDKVAVATDWLTQNGYDLTGRERELLGPYLEAGFNLLAFKLTEGAYVDAIRPVMLTYESERPSIPLLATAVSAQRDMRIQVWVIGPSQAVPSNYKSLVLNDALLDWRSGRTYVAGTLPEGGDGPVVRYVDKPINYDAVVIAAANEAGGQGFVTELGGPASQFRETVWSALDADDFATLSTESYADGLDAVLAAQAYYAGWDGWEEAIVGATTLPDEVTIEELGRDPEAYRGVVEIDTARFMQLLDEKVVRPVAATAALLYEGPYLTRLYTTMSAREMTLDPSFDYNADLAQLSNVHFAKQHIECSADRTQDEAPWRIELPQGGVVLGEGEQDWPVAVGSMPANLKVVMLSTEGSGSVLQDNSQAIATKLLEAAGTLSEDLSLPQLLPEHGASIGGSQRLKRPSDARDSSSACTASRAHEATSSTLALCMPLAAAMLAWRRSRACSRVAGARRS